MGFVNSSTGSGWGWLLIPTATIGITEVPSQRIEVAENMAARAGRFAVARGGDRVVEERASVYERSRLRIVQRVNRPGGFGREVYDFDRVIETRHHVKPIIGLIERHARGPAADRRQVVRALGRWVKVGFEGGIFDLGSAEDADSGGAESSDIKRLAIT